MEEVQRIVGESGEAVAIWREWELKDEAVNWLLSQRGYIRLNGFDDGDEYVLLLQVLRDLESLERACLAGQEEVVVTRSLVEQEEAEGGGGAGAGSAACKLLASFCYLESPKREQSQRDESIDAAQDDLRYYYRTADCKLRLPASDSDNDAVEKQPVEGHRSAEDVSQGWKACCSLVLDSSRLHGARGQMSVCGTKGDGTAVEQKQIVRLQLDAWARRDEFHLDLKLQVRSLSVGVSKKEFIDTNSCLGFFPDWIRLSMEPCWVEEHISEAIFENLQITGLPPSKSSTLNTEIGVNVGMAPFTVSAKRSWGQGKTTTREDHDVIIEYDTGEGGVASVEWQMCRWGDGRPYKSDRPLSPSWISGSKLPKLPFKGTTPPLKDFAAVSWRLPISAMRNPQQELAVKIRVCSHMRLISLAAAAPFLKLPKSRKFPLEQEFGPFIFQLPAALRASDAASS